MKKKILFGTLALCSVAALAAEETYRHAFGRREPWTSRQLRRVLDAKRESLHDNDFYEERDNEEAYAWERPHEEFMIRNSRGQSLRGYLWTAGKKRSNTVAFVIHGFRSDGCQAAGQFLSYYKSRGIDVFACDHAGAGNSEGDLFSYDYYESIDCLLWMDVLTGLYGDQVRILLHGFSMGASTVLRLSDQCPPQVRFLVADCGYTSARDILSYQAGGCRLFYPILRVVNFIAAGFDLNHTDVRPHIQNAKLPLLLVHGSADPTVPYTMAEEIDKLYSSPHKDFMTVENGRHVESYRSAAPNYEAKLDAFLNQFCPR